MTLAAGTRLGPYEILSLLGEGGMGVVYKAKDTRLERIVAVKVLSEKLAAHPDRKARFEREAKAISKLNHPHIATLYDIGEEDGIDFLVMEYIEGETLADRLRRGPLSREDALGYGAQIARALDCAHRAGIVHRDLKPGNVMLTTPTGAKLLDFGLAKTLDTNSEAPTEQREITREGAVLGTLQYMAPEQLEGKSADARSDIYALGAVVYEMLTGTKAFDDRRQSIAPQALEDLVQTALSKDPEERWQSAADMARLLDNVPEEYAAPERRRNPWRVAAALLVGALVGYGAFRIRSAPAESSSGVVRFTVESPSPLIGTPALSPDGRQLVFQGSRQLYVRNLDELEPELLVDDTSNNQSVYPFFSPDGRSVGFARRLFQKGISKVDISGGEPVLITGRGGVAGGTWIADDTIVFGQPSAGLRRISVFERTDNLLTTPDVDEGERSHGYPRALPGGTHVLFALERDDGIDIAVVSLSDGSYRSLTEGTTATYLHTGYLVFARSEVLHAAPFDLDRLELTGEPVPVVRGVRSNRWGGANHASYALSKTGTLAYIPGDDASNRSRLVWVDRDGRVTALSAPVERDYIYPRLSPDDTRVSVSGQTDERSLWLVDVERGTTMRFTFEGSNWISAWRPDSAQILFNSDHEGQGIYRQDTDAAEGAVAVLTLGHTQWPDAWASDASVIASTEVSAETNGDIWILSPDGSERSAFVNTAFDERAADFSPDARYIVFTSDESGQSEVYVQPYPGPGRKELVSNDGGREPRWSPRGDEIFYRRGDEMISVAVELTPALKLGQPKVLFRGDFEPTRVGHRNYDVTADAQRFVMVEAADEDETRIHVIVNWHEELERLMADARSR